MNVYEENGFKNRMDYLNHLSDETGMDIEHVIMMASLLGESEDFDGLVSNLEDQSNGAI